MIDYFAIGKYAAIAAALGGIAWAIHSNGRALELGECRARENKALEQVNRELDTARQRAEQESARAAAIAAENLRLNSEVTHNAQKSFTAAAAADAVYRADPIGLRLPAEICAAPRIQPMPAPANSAKVDHSPGRSDGVRLPSRIEANLYDLTYRANRARIKRDECREFALGLAKQREEWERAQAAAKGK